jgi:hypothetical protein
MKREFWGDFLSRLCPYYRARMDMINKEQLAILWQGIDMWNNWRTDDSSI